MKANILNVGDVIISHGQYRFISAICEETIFYEDGYICGEYEYMLCSFLDTVERWSQGATVLDTDAIYPGLWGRPRKKSSPPTKPVQNLKYIRSKT